MTARSLPRAAAHGAHAGRSDRARTPRVNDGYEPAYPNTTTSSYNVVAHKCGSAASRSRQ
jgi:hypothetical protein